MPDIRDVAYNNLVRNAQARASSIVTQNALQSIEIAELEAAEHCACSAIPACSACRAAAAYTLHHREEALHQALKTHTQKLDNVGTDRRRDATHFQSTSIPAERNNKEKEDYLSKRMAGVHKIQKRIRFTTDRAQQAVSEDAQLPATHQAIGITLEALTMQLMAAGSCSQQEQGQHGTSGLHKAQEHFGTCLRSAELPLQCWRFIKQSPQNSALCMSPTGAGLPKLNGLIDEIAGSLSQDHQPAEVVMLGGRITAVSDNSTADVGSTGKATRAR